MTPADSGSSRAEGWFTVDDPEQARLLSDQASARFFEPFLARERTASEAAREVGCALDTMLYRVRRFLEAGLLEVSRLEPRAGRPIKHYRSVADAFFVPFALTPFADLEERLATQMEPFQREVVRSLARLLRESGRDGRRLYRKANGDVWNDAASDVGDPFRIGEPGTPIAYDFSMGLRLTDDAAERLQREIHDLFERYAAREGASGKRYLWHTALLPAAEE